MAATNVRLTVGLLLIISLIIGNSSCGQDNLAVNDHPILLVSLDVWPVSVKKIFIKIFLNGMISSEGALAIAEGEPGFVYDLPQGACGTIEIQVTESDGNGTSMSNAPVVKTLDCVSNPQPLALMLPLVAVYPYKWMQVSSDIRNFCATVTACHLKGTTQPFSYDKALTPGFDMANWMLLMTANLIDKTNPTNSTLITVGSGGNYMGAKHSGSNLSAIQMTNWTQWITDGAVYP